MLPKINSAHGSDTRNIINRAIEVLNKQGKAIQDLVAEGQLTEEQYAELITVINGLIKSGHVDKSDLTPEFKTEVNSLATAKADKTYVDSEVAKVASGAPDETFNTLTDLQTAYPSGDSKNKLVAYKTDGITVDGHIYNWDGTEWVDTGILYQAMGIADKSVDASKLTFTSYSTNLFNPDTVSVGKYIASDGTVSDNSSYVLSDFIEVDGGKDHTFSNVTAVSKYDENKSFIDRQDLNSSPQTVPALGTMRYIRVNIVLSSKTGINDVQINEGSELLAFEEGRKPKLSNVLSQVDDGSITRKSIKEKEIDLKHVRFIESSTNLFDKASVTYNSTIDASNGDLIFNDNSSVSDFIEIFPNTWYVGNFARWALYDDSETFLLSAPTGLFKTTENAKYARVVYLNDQLNEAQLNESETLLPFENYKKPKLSSNIDIHGRYATFSDLTPNILADENTTIGKAVSSTGEIIDDATYGITDYIEVKPSTKYVGYRASYIAFYDDNLEFISRHESWQSDKFTTPVNCKFIRVSFVNYRYEEVATINEGEKITTEVNKSYILNDDIYVDTRKQDYYMSDIPINGTFNTDEVYPDVTATWRNSLHTDVYALYDDLMAVYPDYITRELLGNDSGGTPIYLYKFTPKRPSAQYRTKTPKIFITTGTHGFEKHSVWTVYLAMKDVCERWGSDDLLEVLRFNTEFLIIPLVNPHGFDNFTRTNANDVDINRNFSTPDWAEGAKGSNTGWGTYGGTEPGSELETQCVMKVFENNPDIDMVYDYHNFASDGALVEGSNVIWITAANTHVQHMAQSLISRMTRKWRKDVTFIPPEEDFFVGYADHHPSGMIGNYAKELGIETSSTFETAARTLLLGAESDLYDAITTKFSVEAFINWLLINLDELVKRN